LRTLSEELSHDLHPVHERAFDDIQRPLALLPRFLGVLLEEVDDAMYQRVREAFFH
jgi:hypothetical protein